MTRRAALAFLGALALLTACSGGGEEWLAHAEAAHHDADRLLAAGDVSGARAALEHAATEPAPRATNSRDARVVRQDLLARLATLELAQGRPERAAELATQGLELGQARDVFCSSLLIVRGKARAALGDAPGASRDYHDALIVTEALLDEALGGAEKSP